MTARWIRGRRPLFDHDDDFSDQDHAVELLAAETIVEKSL